MNDDTALAVIEEEWGTLEDFALMVYRDHRDLLKPGASLDKQAEVLGVPKAVLGRIMNNDAWRDLMERYVTESHWHIDAQEKHVKAVVGKATDDLQGVKDLVAAGEYLEKRRGRNLGGQAAQGNAGTNIILQFGDVEVVDEYRPLRSGDLPPPEAQKRYRVKGRISKGTITASLADALSEGAEIPASAARTQDAPGDPETE